MSGRNANVAFLQAEGKRVAGPVVAAGVASGLLVGLWLERKWWQALVVGAVSGVAAGAGMMALDSVIEARDRAQRTTGTGTTNL